ncbi:hypothetical protein EIJ81_06540 [Aliivibrio salmonicida]|uniref:Uncharacterized protein n=1 Tax=Aliivibrio salmonicida (strain LFI1238) TaxID=316275 RepID=B6EIE1_ALISL|nr:hypothetical protein [Aliivibrio salmonicida]AZL84321.1 hypothetical protein EIJ81_06540 [Aliivibrio salmonicida]CAQ78652.1 hypothetical protein, putative phage gene [Aliivibrio salmonicida LFI1238]
MSAKEINQIKVFNTIAFLKCIITTPHKFKNDEVLKKALKSQTGIAKYENKDQEITICSLNTLKTTSDTLLGRGFLELNELRLNAKDALENTIEGKKSNKRTKTGLNNRVTELEAKLDIAYRSNFLLTTMISELRSQLKQIAIYEGSVEERKELYRKFNEGAETKLSYTLNGKF